MLDAMTCGSMGCVIEQCLQNELIAQGIWRNVVTINFGKPDETALSRITLPQAWHYYQEGHFPAGSMGPKMMVAIEFVQADPGNRVIITNEENLAAAVQGSEGTHIVAY